MSPEQIAAIRERVEKASPGPWEPEHCSSAPDGEACGIWAKERRVVQDTSREECWHMMTDADADFIAHARQDIPALLAYVEELESKLKWHERKTSVNDV